MAARWQCRWLRDVSVDGSVEDKYVTDEKMLGGEETSLSLAMDRVMVETKIARDLWGISMRGL